MALPKHERVVGSGFLASGGLRATPGAFHADCGRSLLAPLRRFDPAHPELIERPGMDRVSLWEELQTLENCNRRLGGHDLVLRYVGRLVRSAEADSFSRNDEVVRGTHAASLPSSPARRRLHIADFLPNKWWDKIGARNVFGEPPNPAGQRPALPAPNAWSRLSILDLGTGMADIPRAIAAWARKRNLPVVITAVDRNPEILQIAREACRDWPEIQFAQHDLRSLPYRAGSYDLVLCSTALHHFDPADAVTVLRSMHDIARRGYVVNDLCRNWLAILAVELFVRALGCGPVMRHDAVQSVRAAFTVPELQTLARRAGLSRFQIIRHHAHFHMVLEGTK